MKAFRTCLHIASYCMCADIMSSGAYSVSVQGCDLSAYDLDGTEYVLTMRILPEYKL